MKKYSYIILILLIWSGIILSQVKSSVYNSVVEFTSSNLPIVVINTNGQEIVDDYKITADMGIIYNGEGIRNNLTDQFNNYNGKIGIEIRGSSSQMFPKKQYAVETRDDSGNDIKVSLLGFPSESDWILFAPYNDKSLMRDALAYRIASDMGRYASRSKFCEVVLNGEYNGVYVLLEKVKRDANRVNIKKLEPPDTSGNALTGGYIIKIDKTDGETTDGWYSDYLPFSQTQYKIYYQYHYPKPEDIAASQKLYIKNRIFFFETVMKYNSDIADSATGYPKYIDTDSFVDFILTNEVTKNVDAYRLSTYLYKNRDDINPKIFAGPVWDFNLGFGNADYYEGWKTEGWQIEILTDFQNIPDWESFLTPFWWRKLYDDTNFRNKVYARWQYLRTRSLSTTKILSYVDSLATLLDESKTRNFEKWPVLGIYVWPNPYPYYLLQTYQEELDYLKSWIINRLNWLDQNMIGEPTIVEETKGLTPDNFVLEQNYPNPFNPTTKISWQSPANSWQTIKVFNSLGQELETIVNEYLEAGSHSKLYIVNSTLPSGVYFYQLRVGDYTETKKMVLLR